MDRKDSIWAHYVYVPTGGEPRLLILGLDPASGGPDPEGGELRAPGGAMCTDPGRSFGYVAAREQPDIGARARGFFP